MCLGSLFCICILSCPSQHHLFKKLSLFYCNIFASLSQMSWPCLEGLFLVTLFCSFFGQYQLSWIVFVVQLPSRVWLCYPMDCSMPGFPVPHHILKFVQVHIHLIGDAIQQPHPLSTCLPSTLNISQDQSLSLMSQLLKSGSQSIGTSASAPALPMGIQGWLPLGLTGLIYLESKGLSRVFSRTAI